jgi:DNA-directed RNA polymerase subunit N (RpoN/RPB10)
MYPPIRCVCGKHLGSLHFAYIEAVRANEDAYYKKNKIEPGYPSAKLDISRAKVHEALCLNRECCINRMMSSILIRDHI